MDSKKLKLACQGKTRRQGGLNTYDLRKLIRKKDVYVEDYRRITMQNALCTEFLPQKQRYKLTYKLRPLLAHEFDDVSIKETKKIIAKNMTNINKFIERTIWGIPLDIDDIRKYISDETYGSDLFTLKLDDVKYIQKSNTLNVKVTVNNNYNVKKSELTKLIKKTIKKHYYTKQLSYWGDFYLGKYYLHLRKI